MKHGDPKSQRANRRRKALLVLLALLLLIVLLVDLFQPDDAAQPTDAPVLATFVGEGLGEAPAEGRCLYAEYCVDYVAGRDRDAASVSGRVAPARAGGGDAGQLFDRLSPRTSRYEYDANFGVACSSPALCLGGLGAGAPIPTLALSVGNKPLPEETGERLVLQGYLPREAWGRSGGWAALSGGADDEDANDSDLTLAPGGGLDSFNGGLTAGGGFGGGSIGGFVGGRPGSPGDPVTNRPEQLPPARNQDLGDSGSNGSAGGGGSNSGGSGAGNPGGGNNAGGGNPGGNSNPSGGNPGGGDNPGGGGGGSNGPSVPLDLYLDDDLGGGSGDGGGNLFTPPDDPDDSNDGDDVGSNGGGTGGGGPVIEDLPGVGDDEEDLQPSEVPEPANLVLVGTGLAYGLLQWRKRRTRT